MKKEAKESFAQCPENVKSLFDAVNSVKFDAVLPSAMDYMTRLSLADKASSAATDDYRERDARAFAEWLADLERNPDVTDFATLKTFLIANPGATLDPTFSWKTESQGAFSELRTLMLLLVTHAEWDRRYLIEQGERCDTWRPYHPAFLPVRLYVTDAGPPKKPIRTVSLRLDQNLQAIEGCDIRRFRQCPHPKCRKFFWAERLEREACCSAHNSQIRKWRARLDEVMTSIKRLEQRIEHETLKGTPQGEIRRLEGLLEKQYVIAKKYHFSAKRKW